MKITRNMKIDEIIRKYPEVAEIFDKYGFHCIGCAASSFETLAQGAVAHGMDTSKLIKDLNKAIEK